MTDAPPPPFDVILDVKFELLAEGVERLTEQLFGLPVTRLAAPWPAAPRKGARPQVLIADLGGELGQSELRVTGLLARAPKFSLLIIMLVEWDDVAIRLMRAGARGILYPDASVADFVDAVRTVAGRQTYLPQALQRTLAERYVGGATTEIDALTPRELEFMRRLSQGMGAREIAHDLGVSVKTADTHRANLLRKLGARNNVELARLALRHGLVPL